MSVNYYEPPVSAPEQAPTPVPTATANAQAADPYKRYKIPAGQAGANEPKKPGSVRRFFSGVGTALTWTRNTILNIFFLIIVLMILAAIGSNAPQPLPEKFALRIAPSGVLVDQLTHVDAASLLLADEDAQDSETLVRDLVDAINNAATDPRVTLLILEPGNLLGGGISKLNDIGQALENFKKREKKVIAVASNYSQDQYYLASFADEIYLHNMGSVVITGYGRYMSYYKTALDKLGVTIHAFRSGKYKDFLEPYLRDNMSDESREHNAQWINQLWGSYAQQIETARKLPAGSLNDYINNLDAHMTLTAGDSAQLALEKGLVDKVTSRPEMEKMLVELAGKNKDGEDYNGVSAATYLQHIRSTPDFNPNKIGLIVASGSIVDGKQPDGTIGSDSMVELLRTAKKDDQIKALVIRIDSGGGSAFASEIIREEMLELRSKNIPIFISMGTVAASGGYWIATAGDQIWAQSTTITGSIGVFGAFPTIEKSLQKIGITTDGVGSTDLAGAMRIDRPLSDKASKVVQQGVDNIYQRFITLVAEARKQDVNAINEIAQGHVWTGTTAKEIGLVDHLGTLNDVIAAIATEAKLDSYKVEVIQRQLSPKEEFLRQLTAANAGVLLPKSWLESFTTLSILNDLGPVVKPLSDLQKMNDPQGIYVQCIECVAP